MKGTLYVCNVYKDKPVYDINLLITRQNKVIKGWKHIPELAPSSKLFRQFLVWKKENLWPLRWKTYEKIFLKEMQVEVFQRYLKQIIQRLHEGKNVSISCYCYHENYCHRKLIAEWFEKRGYKVVYVTANHLKEKVKKKHGEINKQLRLF